VSREVRFSTPKSLESRWRKLGWAEKKADSESRACAAEMFDVSSFCVRFWAAVGGGEAGESGWGGSE
jgi:hypothetical protein